MFLSARSHGPTPSNAIVTQQFLVNYIQRAYHLGSTYAKGLSVINGLVGVRSPTDHRKLIFLTTPYGNVRPGQFELYMSLPLFSW
jgi:hypothetical protein